jgi:hypothetical protein
METTNENICRLLEMLDTPNAYSEQEFQDIINHDEETREAYYLMVAARQGYRHEQTPPKDADAAWQRFEQEHYKQKEPSQHWWIRVAAIFIAVAFLCGLSLAAYQAISDKQVSKRYTNEKMLQLSEDGKKVIVTWLKGTWVEKDNGSYIEDYPIVNSPALPLYGEYRATIKVDGTEIESGNLPDLPASSVKKVEIHFCEGKTVNLITTSVQRPADVKGNINPEMTILLTGTPPKDCGTKTTIWIRHDNYDGFSWKNYSFTSWKWDVDDISYHLNEVSICKNHHVRINVCKGVPLKHIDRIKAIMRECNVTNYEFVQQ